MKQLKHNNTSVVNINYHMVWCPKYRRKVLVDGIDDRLKTLLPQIAKDLGCEIKSMEVMPDHIHILTSLPKTMSLADFARAVKANSSRWIKTISPKYEKFAWQGGYAAFSVSQSQVDTVMNYIGNQAEHHKKQNFQDEYITFLQLHKIEYDEKYVLSD